MAVRNKNNRTRFQAWAKDITAVAATDPAAAAIVPLKVGYTIYVTSIKVVITTSTTKVWTFQDDTAVTPVVLAVVKSAPGVGVALDVKFGEEGTPLTADQGLDLTTTGAGLAGRIHLEGFYRQSSTLSL